MAIVHATVFGHASNTGNGDPIQYTSATIDGSNSAAISKPTGTQARHRCRVRLWAESAAWVNWGASSRPARTRSA